MLPKGKKKVGCCGRPSEDLQAMFNAIFYVLRSGCSWRMLPNDFPKWETVYRYFNRWSKANVWEKINGLLVREVRKNTKRPGKKKKVRKKRRVSEKAGAQLLLSKIHSTQWLMKLCKRMTRTEPMRLVWADAGYQGDDLAHWVAQLLTWTWQIVLRKDDVKGFVVIPRR